MSGEVRSGTVNSLSIETATRMLEQSGVQVLAISPLNEPKGILSARAWFFEHVSMKDLVILSRQIATLSEAQVSALRIFRLMSQQVENVYLSQVLTKVSDDLQGGTSISRALSKYPNVFSAFYVSMVKAGEDSGTLSKSFTYLADYLDRNYAIITKVRSALIYPIFVIIVFIAVMALMLVMVIPKISEILKESGQELPIYTKAVIGLSTFTSNNFGYLVVVLSICAVVVWQYVRTEAGQRSVDELKIRIPAIGNLYRKLYMTRICDNLATMLSSGLTMLQSLEITAEVVDNREYRDTIEGIITDVKAGRALSDASEEHELMPVVFSQMTRAGEESGALADILNTLSIFYRREVDNAVTAIISLIEPALIVVLGFGVGILIASVLVPLYNMTGAF